VTAEIKYMNSSSPVTVAGIGGTITAGSTTLTQNWSYRNTIYVAADLKDDSELPFTVEWSYSYLGNTFRGQTSVIGPRV
jgi:signal recognition particle receptor subunit beta